jgi:hypothetical protein
MVEWFTWTQVLVCVVAGLLCLVLGAVGRTPDDFSMGAALLVEILLLVQVVVALISPGMGNAPSGNPLEFFTYLVSAVVLLPLAGFWGLVERTKWSTLILGVACLAAAVMVYRMYQIWTVQSI